MKKIIDEIIESLPGILAIIIILVLSILLKLWEIN
jgi:hypothetical protein